MSNLGIHINRKRQDGKTFKVQAVNKVEGFVYVIYNQNEQVVEIGQNHYATPDIAVKNGLLAVESV